MMRSLFSGVSGLRSQQTGMDVIGNNIANVNTIGYKASRVTFSDVLSQTIQGAASPQGGRGGTNPKQIGLGVTVASIDTLFGNSSFQSTGNPTDLAIQNDGFFMVTDGSSTYYTRAGNFDFDEDDNFVIPGTGLRVLGYMADVNGNINTSGQPTPIQLALKNMDPSATTIVDFANNLKASELVGTQKSITVKTFDTLGVRHDANVTYTKSATNQWLVSVSVPDALPGTVTNAHYVLNFDTNGKLTSVSGLDPTVTAAPPAPATTINIPDMKLDNSADGKKTVGTYTVFDRNNIAHTLEVTFTYNAADDNWTYNAVDNASGKSSGGTVEWDTATSTYTGFSSLTVGSGATADTFTINLATPVDPAVAGPISVDADPSYTTAAVGNLGFSTASGGAPSSIELDFSSLKQDGSDSNITGKSDGWAAGVLDSKTVDTSGTIVGHFSNDRTLALGQISLATFSNPGGLIKIGGTLFTESSNSGDPNVGTPGSGGRGTINPGNLEMSNVDLAQEFSNMIVTQRAFQANSKIISTSDEMLQELANLKR